VSIAKSKPDKIVKVGGREFKLYETIHKESGMLMITLPNFEENPEYTDDGRPFTLRVQDDCLYGKSTTSEEYDGDCAGCVWFHLAEPYDPIGVCMCDERKLPLKYGEQS